MQLSWILLFASASSLIVSVVAAALPLFIRGRPVGGFVGAPKVSDEFLQGTVLPPENWFDQRLYHFDNADLRTWKQRYFVNGTYFNRKGNGPVFLMIGGEGTANALWVVVGSMVKYAAKYGALCLLLEHRFYGKSHPLGDMSDDSLQYLSSEQALADLAAFRQAMQMKFGLTGANKWISFGGSYPGALSAWFRLKYPHLVAGSVATSAPIQAVLDFPQYYEVVTKSLATTGAGCNQQISIATKMFETLVQTSEGMANLSKIFKLCKPITKNEQDIMNFATSLAGNFAGVVQYNKDNRAFEGAKGTNITIETLCGIMNNEKFGDALSRYAQVNNVILATYGEKCLDVSYKDFISSMQQTAWGSSASEGGRQWMYQTCTEFGYYQTTDSQSQPFGKLSPLSFSVQQCIDIFGSKFNSTNINRGIDFTNTNYGGFGYNAEKVLFVNGAIDPWHALSFTTNIPSYLKAIYMQGTAHCANMYPATANDPPQLTAARTKIEAIIGVWLRK
eukprot:Seg2620.1 transcript_id=Seg2620.1/GoldUCD/mRNA.D3Y31 product="putative serine protease K12H4.7" protein_id=Seg2620.1/GoldUCD/D3Y31